MERSRSSFEKAALSITRWVGSPASLVVHSLVFAASFLAPFLGFVAWERMLLVVTTLVSLEAIYLAVFIQMSLNYANQTIESVEEDLDEIQKDVDEIQKDVDELQEDVEDIEEADEADRERKKVQKETLDDIKKGLARLMEEVDRLK